MRTAIYIFLALFIWASIPVDAIASRRDRDERRSTSYSEHDNYDRQDRKHEVKKNRRKHQRKNYNARARHWRQAPRVKYVTVPYYRSYDLPTWYVYPSTPGLIFYINW